MLQILSLAQWNAQNSAAAIDTKVVGTVPTLIVEWDGAPGLRWVLRLVECWGDAHSNWGYQPEVVWQTGGPRPLAHQQQPAGTTATAAGVVSSAQVSAQGDELAWRITLENRTGGGGTLPGCWAWICLVHRWAQAFQANC